MFNTLLKTALTKLNPFTAAIPTGIKAIKYFMDSTVREKVTPVAGSVLYCDLWVAVEHSGIYVGNGNISNIEVEGIGDSAVRRCSASSFTSKSTLGKKIYVSCNKHGAVGDDDIADYADAQVGERSFYGLVFKNCHEFSTKCVEQSTGANANPSWLDHATDLISLDTWEPTIGTLKKAARKNLGATKWRLWDWQNQTEQDTPEPDWQANQDYFKHLALAPQTIEQIQQQLAEAQAYEQEIADENIPEPVRQHLINFSVLMQDISEAYQKAKEFLAVCPDAKFSYADLKNTNEDFAALAATMQNNVQIKELARKMGRAYISEEKKKQTKIPQASKSEVHGTHRSDDVMRMLPSELLNLEDDTLEVLFYARLLEKQLLTYELQGTTQVVGETSESQQQRTGPVVACLDTSGSMQGHLLKAKALLLAIANILKKENRSLHVLLFGASGEVREFAMLANHEAAGLLKFLQQGFGGGTDFETPLQKALDIITLQKDYQKADILMISDGDCQLSAAFNQHFVAQKQQLDCMVYSVLCAGVRVKESFSDEVMVL